MILTKIKTFSCSLYSQLGFGVDERFMNVRYLWRYKIILGVKSFKHAVNWIQGWKLVRAVKNDAKSIVDVVRVIDYDAFWMVIVVANNLSLKRDIFVKGFPWVFVQRHMIDIPWFCVTRIFQLWRRSKNIFYGICCFVYLISSSTCCLSNQLSLWCWTCNKIPIWLKFPWAWWRRTFAICLHSFE